MNGLFLIAVGGFAGLMVGLILHKKLKERKLFYEDAVALCNHIYSNISYRCDTLKDIFSGFSPKCPQFATLQLAMMNYLDGIDSKWENGSLKQDEVDEIKQFFMSLGKVDAQTQLNDLKVFKSIFESKFEVAKQIYEKKGKAYLKLCLLAGVLFGILLL